MNLVKLIQEQLSGDALNKLSRVIDADPDSTAEATSAAVPTLLSGLVSQFSSGDGIKRLSGILSGFDSSSTGNFANMLGGDSSGLLGKGSGLLGSLFGDSILSSMASAIGRFSGIGPGAVKTLLAYLTPLVLGKVASQWRAQGGTPNALSSLLNEQRQYIPNSMPAGFSLDDVPGLAGAQDAVRSAADTTRRGAAVPERAAPSMASWLIPAAVVLLLGFLAWNFLKPRDAADRDVAESTPASGEQVVAMKPPVDNVPEMPTAAKVGDELNATFKSLGDTFASIKDEASAEAAAPKLEEMSAKLDTLKKMFARLPEAAQSTLQQTVDQQMNPIKERAQQTLAIPGLSDRIKTLINQIVTKLEEWKIIERTG